MDKNTLLLHQMLLCGSGLARRIMIFWQLWTKTYSLSPGAVFNITVYFISCMMLHSYKGWPFLFYSKPLKGK